MFEHDAFLWAVCENPDDDAPRLVYADWLEELMLKETSLQPETVELLRCRDGPNVFA